MSEPTYDAQNEWSQKLHDLLNAIGLPPAAKVEYLTIAAAALMESYQHGWFDCTYGNPPKVEPWVHVRRSARMTEEEIARWEAEGGAE